MFAVASSRGANILPLLWKAIGRLTRLGNRLLVITCDKAKNVCFTKMCTKLHMFIAAINTQFCLYQIYHICGSVFKTACIVRRGIFG